VGYNFVVDITDLSSFI